MNLKKILSKFDRFDPKTDCLVMIGAEERFSFYAPDRHTRGAESAEAMPDHVLTALTFAYLLAHADEHPEILQGLVDKALEWMHR